MMKISSRLSKNSPNKLIWSTFFRLKVPVFIPDFSAFLLFSIFFLYPFHFLYILITNTIWLNQYMFSITWETLRLNIVNNKNRWIVNFLRLGNVFRNKSLDYWWLLFVWAWISTNGYAIPYFHPSNHHTDTILSKPKPLWSFQFVQITPPSFHISNLRSNSNYNTHSRCYISYRDHPFPFLIFIFQKNYNKKKPPVRWNFFSFTSVLPYSLSIMLLVFKSFPKVRHSVIPFLMSLFAILVKQCNLLLNLTNPHLNLCLE
jgi:hypothetical protein